jgi:hypothetical protein
MFIVVATGNHFWADGMVAVVIDAVVISVQSLLTHHLRLVGVPRQAVEPASAATSSPSQPLSRVSQGNPAHPVQVTDSGWPRSS